MFVPLQQKDKISPDSYEDDADDNTDDEKDNAYHSKGDCKTNKQQLRPKTSVLTYTRTEDGDNCHILIHHRYYLVIRNISSINVGDVIQDNENKTRIIRLIYSFQFQLVR